MGLENPIHLILILLVVLLVFGAKRLPEMGRSLGDGLRGFKDAVSGQPPVAHVSPVAHAMAASEPELDPVVATPVTAVGTTAVATSESRD